MVRAHSGPPFGGYGGLAQLGERLICIQEVSGSIPLFSTIPAQAGICTLKTEQRREKKSKATEGAAETPRKKNSIVETFYKGKYNFV